jgi:hypothetical protein
MTGELFTEFARVPYRGPRKMPVITLWQPWAQWVAWGWKTIETRTHERFRCLEGYRIGIHAGRKWDVTGLHAAVTFLDAFRIQRTEEEFENRVKTGGRIIATARVARFSALGDIHAPKALIECTTRRWGLFLEDIRPLANPVPATGGQGIWYTNAEVIEQAA